LLCGHIGKFGLLSFARGLCGLPMRFLRLFERALRMIERLYRELVRGEVVLLPVMRCRNPVSMGGSLVHLGSYLMCVHWHMDLLY
jgi:hypothetical protein